MKGRAVLALAAILCAAGCPKQAADDLIRAALQRALVDAKDLPDIAMVSEGEELIVRTEIQGSPVEITPAALPEVPGRKLVLLKPSQILERSRNVGDVYYVVINYLELHGNEATMMVGVAVQPAPERHDLLMCCCTGEARYALVDGKWVYRGSGGTVCP